MSVPLATELLSPPYKLTTVGTIHHDKPEIPTEMKGPGERAIGTSIFRFDGHKTMVFYKMRKKKVVLLISTCHGTPQINEDSKKHEIINVTTLLKML